MEQNNSNNNDQYKGGKLDRRNALKSLATLPVLGAMAYGVWKKTQHEHYLRSSILDELGLAGEPVVPTIPSASAEGKPLRLGVIGYGIRGPHLLRAAGFAHPDWIDEVKKSAKENPNDKRYEEYLNQDNLNVQVTAVCDVFDVHAKRGIEAGANVYREGVNGKMGDAPKRYQTFKELLEAPDVDAVIIATPDHWHATMAIEAAKAGKHVYLEKPMSWTVPETYELRKTIKESGIVFQLGHQGRQTDSYNKAKEAIEKQVLGKITMIEVCTNRNDPNGAWVYDIHPDANPQTIDWKQFIGPAPWHDFSLERFFRWRCWWDYSTGLNGDLLTHEYDAINQIMGLGIPSSVVSSGGVYFYKDGRTVPDVLQVAMEFDKHDCTLLYSATLASERNRGKVIMGHDASMELGETLSIKADPRSTRYKEKIENGIIKPELPIYTYIPGKKNVDAVTSPTEQYFAGRGLLYTYRNGKRVDTTHLHMKEWIDAIRAGVQPSCNIDQGFQEAISAHMSTIALREGRRVYWDAEKEQIV